VRPIGPFIVPPHYTPDDIQRVNEALESMLQEFAALHVAGRTIEQIRDEYEREKRRREAIQHRQRRERACQRPRCHHVRSLHETEYPYPCRRCRCPAFLDRRPAY
jgi:hypothetical protein